MVHLSLALVGWGMRMKYEPPVKGGSVLTGNSFWNICELFGLHQLKHLRLDAAKFDTVARAYLAAIHTSSTQEARAAAARTLDQGMCISLKELRLLSTREYSNESPMMFPSSIDGGTEDDGTSRNQDLADESASDFGAASQNMHATNGSVAVSNEQPLFCQTQPSTDSGYISDTGCPRQHDTTLVLQSSGVLTLPTPLSTQQDPTAAASETGAGGEWGLEVAGQKRLQVEDNATSKRYRVAAAGTLTDSVPGQALNAGPGSANPAGNTDIAGTQSSETRGAQNGSDGSNGSDLASTLLMSGSVAGPTDEHIPDLFVGNGMSLMDFWAGTGSDMMDLHNVNLATPTDLPDFLGAEQPYESSPPVAGSENEHRAE